MSAQSKVPYTDTKMEDWVREEQSSMKVFNRILNNKTHVEGS